MELARSSVYDEAKSVMKKNKATPEEVEVQITQYRRHDGFPDDMRFNGKKALSEASVIVKELSPMTNLFMCGSMSLAAIARKRPIRYNTILSALLGFDPNFETRIVGHAPSIHYSFGTAFLGFLRCTHPAIIESRDRLLRALRTMNAGDAADQVIRKVDKMIKNTDRASRDTRFNKEDQLSSQLPVSGDFAKKRSMFQDNEGPMSPDDLPAKRARYGSFGNPALPLQFSNDSGQDHNTLNGVSSNVTSMDSLTPVEQMVAMIGALMAEGERGADIGIANMRHLPKNPPPFTNKLGNIPMTSQTCSSTTLSQAIGPSVATVSQQAPVFISQVASPFSSAIAGITSLSDVNLVSNLPADSKRDPRRDPRCLDPRRVPVPVVV